MKDEIPYKPMTTGHFCAMCFIGVLAFFFLVVAWPFILLWDFWMFPKTRNYGRD